MNIYKNFLDKKDFKKLKSFLMSDQMPWYYNDGVNNVPDKNFQFTYLFYNFEFGTNCSQEVLNFVKPIMNKLKNPSFTSIKANLLTRTDKIIEHGYHTDKKTGKTCIFYINTCNGYTKFKDGKKIMSEENKIVTFDSDIEHTGSSCTNKKRRVVINFNYQ